MSATEVRNGQPLFEERPTFPIAYGIVAGVSCIVIMAAVYILLCILSRRQMLEQVHSGRSWDHGDEMQLRMRERREAFVYDK